MKRQLLAFALLTAVAGPALAAECSATVESNDQMRFNVDKVVVPKSCESFEVTLKHVGKLPKTAMGHNFVVSTAADQAGVVADGIAAGAANGYLKADDARVIAASELIGGGESSSFSIPVSALKADEAYSFFCSFPGHASIMKGELVLGD